MADETVTKEKTTSIENETDLEKSGETSGTEAGKVSVEPSTGEFRKPKKPFKKNIRKSRRKERTKSEFDSKIISIRRVTRVVAGGRRFSFSVSLVAGDRKGSVGVGTGKANDTTLAIEKAMKDAKKKMVTLSLTPERSIPFDVRSKFTASDVMMSPAPAKGLSAGSSARTVLELAGITDVTAKIFSRSKNQLNNARATFNALKKIGYKRYEKPKVKVAKNFNRKRDSRRPQGVRQ